MRIRFAGCTCCAGEPYASGGVSRRGFVAGGIVGLATVAAHLGGTRSAAAQIAAPAFVAGKPQRIDVHHHYIPPFHAEYIASRRDRGRPPAWSVAMSLEEMDRNGIATAVTSLAQPGVWFGDTAEGRRLARECNEWGAQMVRDHPRRFGLFAAVPLPDTEGSLREIEYALDVLKADGIGLFTSYRDKYLGDASFAPVFDELHRRKAVVFTHPLAPDCCKSLVPGVPPSTIEYATDTTRAIAGLVFSGTTLRCPDIRFIFSHSGGTLPFLTARFERLAEERKDARMPNGPIPEPRKLYYEVAQGNTPAQLAALVKLASVSHALFGTDFPFRLGRRGRGRRGQVQVRRRRPARHRARQRARALAAAAGLARGHLPTPVVGALNPFTAGRNQWTSRRASDEARYHDVSPCFERTAHVHNAFQPALAVIGRPVLDPGPPAAPGAAGRGVVGLFEHERAEPGRIDRTRQLRQAPASGLVRGRNRGPLHRRTRRDARRGAAAADAPLSHRLGHGDGPVQHRHAGADGGRIGDRDCRIQGPGDVGRPPGARAHGARARSLCAGHDPRSEIIGLVMGGLPGLIFGAIEALALGKATRTKGSWILWSAAAWSMVVTIIMLDVFLVVFYPALSSGALNAIAAAMPILFGLAVGSITLPAVLKLARPPAA